MEDELFQVGEKIAFRGTDGYSFNLLQVTKEYNIVQITTRTDIKGNSLIPSEENDEDNLITFVADPRWKNGSLRLAHVLRVQQDKTVSMKMAASPDDSSVKFKLEKDTFEKLQTPMKNQSHVYKINILMNRLRMSLVVHQNLMEQRHTRRDYRRGTPTVKVTSA